MSEESGSFIRTITDTPSSSENIEVLNLDEGGIIGSGKLMGKIGEGGMATVYKIWNEDLDTFRAIKIAKPDADEHFCRRFVSEARIVEKLKHHNIIEIKNIQYYRNLPFIEMEYVDGCTLRDLLTGKGGLALSVSCSIAFQVLHALKYAHSETVSIEGKEYNGIFHRDLKPENIMITRNGRIVVMDFGLARPIAQGINSTCINTFVGTPQYAAPEQFQLGKIDHRADLYAMGIILYEMVTGHHPFAGMKEQCGDLEEYLTNRRCATWKMVDIPAVRLPKRLSAIIRKCLENDCTKRYQNADELLDELKQIKCDSTKLDSKFISLSLFTGDSKETDAKKTSGTAVKHRPSVKLLSLLAGGILVPACILLFVFGRERSQKEPESIDNSQTESIQLPPASSTDNTDISETGIQSQEKERQPVSEPRSPPPMEKKHEPATRAGITTHDTSRLSIPEKSSSSVDAADKVQKKSVNRKHHTKKENSGDNPQKDPLVLLKQKYGSDDIIKSAAAAINRKQFDDALQLLDALPGKHPDMDKKIIMQLDCFIQTGKYVRAKQIVSRASVNAAEFNFQAGKYYYTVGNYVKAIGYFNRAQEKRCIFRGRKELLADALYYSACSYQKRFEEDTSPENRSDVRNAWYLVKRMLPEDDPRYRQATQELSRL